MEFTYLKIDNDKINTAYYTAMSDLTSNIKQFYAGLLKQERPVIICRYRLLHSVDERCGDKCVKRRRTAFSRYIRASRKQRNYSVCFGMHTLSTNCLHYNIYSKKCIIILPFLSKPDIICRKQLLPIKSNRRYTQQRSRLRCYLRYIPAV